jgi:hypothetical protein
LYWKHKHGLAIEKGNGTRMSDLDSKRREFEERLEALAGKTSAQAVDPAEGQPGIQTSLTPDLQERLREWEANLDRRLEEFRRGSEAQLSSAGTRAGLETAHLESHKVKPGAQKSYRPDETALEWFQDTETMMLTELEWGRHPLPAGFQGDFELVASDEAMKTAIARACGLPDAPKGVPWKDYQLGVFHVPGRATFINPSHYSQLKDQTGRQVEQRYAKAKAVSDMAMERWGWGFLLEYTSLGRKAGAAGLWPAMLAERAGLTSSDPADTQMAHAIRCKWTILKHGWQDWIWQYVMFKSHHPLGNLVDRPRPGRVFELLMRVQDLFPMVKPIFGVSVRLRSLVDLAKFIFLEQTQISPKLLNQFILGLQSMCVENDARVNHLVGMPLSRMFGWLYFSWLENQVGILTTPYALLIAAHEPQIDFADLSAPHEFLGYVNKETRHNPDARLAMLTRLDPRVKYNPRAMHTAAWERLKLEGPREYFK